jgi:hypothetical protein
MTILVIIKRGLHEPSEGGAPKPAAKPDSSEPAAIAPDAAAEAAEDEAAAIKHTKIQQLVGFHESWQPVARASSDNVQQQKRNLALPEAKRVATPK